MIGHQNHFLFPSGARSSEAAGDGVLRAPVARLAARPQTRSRLRLILGVVAARPEALTIAIERARSLFTLDVL
jgi:hypothetical protein